MTSQLSEHLFISHSSICVWVLHAAYSLRQNTQLHCHDRFTGCASRSESSSGCVFWRTIVCMAQHRRTCLTACGRHQRSSVVDVSALLTPRHLQVPSTRRATLRDRAFPVAAARAQNSLPPKTRTCSSLLTFRRETKSYLFDSHTTDLALSTLMVSRRLH